MSMWEYRFEINLGDEGGPRDKDIEQSLNELGQDGWELIAVVPVPVRTKSGGTNLAYYFKRSSH